MPSNADTEVSEKASTTGADGDRKERLQRKSSFEMPNIPLDAVKGNYSREGFHMRPDTLLPSSPGVVKQTHLPTCASQDERSTAVHERVAVASREKQTPPSQQESRNNLRASTRPLNAQMSLPPRPIDSGAPVQSNLQVKTPRPTRHYKSYHEEPDRFATHGLSRAPASHDGRLRRPPYLPPILENSQQEYGGRTDNRAAVGSVRLIPQITPVVVCLSIQKRTVYLAHSHLNFDAPNVFTEALNGDEFVLNNVLVLTRSNQRPEVVHIQEETRPSSIFSDILLPYASGAVILPLSTRNRSILLSHCQPDEDPLAVLYCEAGFWRFERLQKLILREMHNSRGPPAGQHSRSQSPASEITSLDDPPCEAEAGSVTDLAELLETQQHRNLYSYVLNRQQRGPNFARLSAWIHAGSQAVKPSNSSFMRTLGWRSGLLYYDVGPAMPTPMTSPEDLVQPVEGSEMVRCIEYVLQDDEQDPQIGNSVRLSKMQAVEMSCEDFRLIALQNVKGGAFYECMKHQVGRHGLRILYKAGWAAKNGARVRILTEVLVVGYYCRHSLQLTSHPSLLMQKVLPENRWVAPLPSPFNDDDFINDEVDIRGD